ncbi:hypothetical protein EW146_g1478 [Bondarzewia mesenterica]|uniref:Phosphatidate phosphatase APP1 catalytic domain-containing protein n=1 Tax=Bondarzewia mesenterica TaxID=1095465 RepID=A0A4S4M5W0_9AGAM|nr:hypothetical protein EW146_g1478 [Bondarzewia mesenterica]
MLQRLPLLFFLIAAEHFFALFNAPGFLDAAGKTTIAQLQAYVSLRQLDVSPVLDAAASFISDTLGKSVAGDIDRISDRLQLFATIGLGRKEVPITVDGCSPGTATLDSIAGLGGDLGMVLRNATLGSCDGSRLNATVKSNDDRTFTATVFTSQADGFGVISDIDDTVKITNTLDTVKVLEATFIDDPAPVSGMPELYSYLNNALSNPAFFYVSGSPFQLYPFLNDFISTTYPNGPIFLQNLTFTNIEGLIDLVTDNDEIFEYKVGQIETIHGMYPGKKFLTVGDSTQKDPETYGEIFRRFGPDFVSCIWIRRVDGANNTDARFTSAFEGVPSDRFRVYNDSDIADTLPTFDVVNAAQAYTWIFDHATLAAPSLLLILFSSFSVPPSRPVFSRICTLSSAMGNGAKAAQKRERNAEKNGGKGSKSQSKVNEAAKNIVCSICRQPFLITTRAPALEEHSQNKHSKTMAECFPDAAK